MTRRTTDDEDSQLRAWAVEVVTSHLDLEQLNEFCKHDLPKGCINAVCQAKLELLEAAHQEELEERDATHESELEERDATHESELQERDATHQRELEQQLEGQTAVQLAECWDPECTCKRHVCRRYCGSSLAATCPGENGL